MTQMTAANEWQGRAIVGSDDERIGRISDIYVDDQTDRPEWATVTSGLFSTSTHFVPLADASLDGEDVRVPVTKDEVRRAPRIDLDGHLSDQEEAQLSEHYGIAHSAPEIGQRRRTAHAKQRERGTCVEHEPRRQRPDDGPCDDTLGGRAWYRHAQARLSPSRSPRPSRRSVRRLASGARSKTRNLEAEYMIGQTDGTRRPGIGAQEVDEPQGDLRYEQEPRVVERDPGVGRRRQREEFGGIHWGGAFFGWLVATGIAVILVAILSAGGAAIGLTSATSNDLTKNAETIGIGGGIALLIVLLIAYYSGGYVAGRMSRFDGGRQGFGVWVLGVVITLAFAAAGVILGSKYNVLTALNLPRIPVQEGALATGGAIALAAILLGTLLISMVGGKAGRRYHGKVDALA